MNVNGVDVCFGKVVRLTLYAGGESVTLLYAPQLDAKYNANIEAEVEDIANPMRKNNELGFTAHVTVTNPPAQAVQIIAKHIGWLTREDETQEDFEQRAMHDLNGMLQDYYNNRVRCKVEVGYWDYNKKTIPGLTKLFDGYVNGSSLYHDGTDDILKFACHNFNADQISTRAIQSEIMCIYPELERKAKLEEIAKDDFKKRSSNGTIDWESMLRKLISNYSTMRPNPNYNDGVQVIDGMPSSVPAELPVTEYDRVHTEWIQIRYIYTPEDFKSDNEPLRVKMQRLPITGFYTNAGTLADMITDLCNHRDAQVNWIQYDEYDAKHRTAVYFIYPRGAGLGVKRGSEADIKIINYQNLLESPTASASGAMRIRMFLNTDCIPLKRIALILDKGIGAETGTGNSFVVKPSTIFRESMGVQGKLSPYVATQSLAHSMNVYMQEVAAKDIEQRGYLFNTGFPIQKCTHKISTLGTEWETIVETIPVYQGLNVNFKGL